VKPLGRFADAVASPYAPDGFNNLSPPTMWKRAASLVVPGCSATAAAVLQASSGEQRPARMLGGPAKTSRALPSSMACRSQAGVGSTPSQPDRWRPAPAWPSRSHQLAAGETCSARPPLPKQPGKPPRQHRRTTAAAPANCRHHHPATTAAVHPRRRWRARLNWRTMAYPRWIFTPGSPWEASPGRVALINQGQRCFWR